MKVSLPILVGDAFCVALLAGLRRAGEPMFRSPGGLSCGSNADLIRNRYPFRLVDPSELKADDKEVVGEWIGAETKKRVKVVSVSLGIVAAVAVTMAYFMGKRGSTNRG